MEILANPAVIRLRSLLRKVPWVHRTLAAGHRLLHPGYEEAFSHALLGAVRAGDCVWDVGANVGLYTERFAERVGDSGEVIAVEPAPACQDQLEAVRAKVGRDRVRIVPAAFSDGDGEARLSIDAGATAPTNQLSSEGSGILVRMKRGDTLLAEGARAPNVMKIDVEGFEGEVLDGMPQVLRRPELRAVFVEVHFNELARRHREDEPKRIVERLQQNGFRTKWLDASHVAALRA